jgi:chromosome segregation ATPase
MPGKSTLVTLVLAVLLAAASGCADKGYQKADLATEALTSAKAQTSAAQIQLNKTVASLDSLVTRPAPDLKPQYTAYSDNVKLLNEQADALHSRANAMEEKKTAWFTAWDADRQKIKDPAIRAASQARADEAKAQFAKVGDAYKAVQQSFGPLRQHLQDVLTALSNDLSQGGARSLDPILATIKTDQATTNANLDALSAELARVSTEYASKLTPPQAPTNTPSTTSTTQPK